MSTKETIAETGFVPPISQRRRADWNVVVTLPENTFRDARRLLTRWGPVRRTHHFNVLAMKVQDPLKFFNEFDATVRETPGVLNVISHVFAAQAVFDFATVGEFETRARDVILGWADRLADKAFHVRLHRRGLKGILSTRDEERFLAEAIMATLAAAGTPGRIDFDDPDAVIEIETIDGRAGVSLWTRNELQNCRFLGPL